MVEYIVVFFCLPLALGDQEDQVGPTEELKQKFNNRMLIHFC